MAASSSQLTTQKINDIKVTPIKIEEQTKLPRGYKIIGSNPYPNILLMGKKIGGKTTLAINLISKCIGYGSRIVVFSATGYKDDKWKAVAEIMKQPKYVKNQNVFEVYTDIVDTDTKVDRVQELYEEYFRPPVEEQEEEEDEEDTRTEIVFKTNVNVESKESNESKEDEDEEDTIEERIARSKYMWPKLIVVFDDMSTDLRKKSVEKFIKLNRHSNAMVIISTHALHDITPQTVHNMNLAMIFSKIEPNYLQILHERLALVPTFEKFYEMYKYATSNEDGYNWHFLWIKSDAPQEFRRDFDTLISPN